MRKIDYSQFCSYHIGIPSKYEKMVTYCLTGNGAKEIRQNEIGIFVTTPSQIAGLEKIKEGFTMNLPKIPLKILWQIIGFFKTVYKKLSAEAMVQIYWDRSKKEYFCNVPKQEVSGASVKFKRDAKLEKKHLLVADFHSHNTMSSFFSGTDDRDEKESRLFGVIGNIEEPLPTIKLRACSGGSAVDVPLEEVFDVNFDFPREWLNKVKKDEGKISEYSLDKRQTTFLDDSRYLSAVEGIDNDEMIEPNLPNKQREKVEKLFDTIMDELTPEGIIVLTEKLVNTSTYENYL